MFSTGTSIDLNTRPKGKASATPAAFTSIEFIAVFLCSSVAPAARARSLASPLAAPTPSNPATPVPTAVAAAAGADIAAIAAGAAIPAIDPSALDIP